MMAIMPCARGKKRVGNPVDIGVDAAWSAEGQTVTDNPNEHGTRPVMVQLVCNEVRLVNSHHSNTFSGAEIMKHCCWFDKLAHRLLFLDQKLPFFTGVWMQNTNTKFQLVSHHLRMLLFFPQAPSEETEPNGQLISLDY